MGRPFLFIFTFVPVAVVPFLAESRLCIDTFEIGDEHGLPICDGPTHLAMGLEQATVQQIRASFSPIDLGVGTDGSLSSQMSDGFAGWTGAWTGNETRPKPKPQPLHGDWNAKWSAFPALPSSDPGQSLEGPPLSTTSTSSFSQYSSGSAPVAAFTHNDQEFQGNLLTYLMHEAHLLLPHPFLDGIFRPPRT